MQRRHHPEGGHQGAAAEVGDLAAGLDRRAVLGAGQAEQPDQAEVVHVVAGALGVGAVLAVAGDRAEDDRRVGLAHALVADPEPVEHAGAEAVEDDVVALDQAQQRLAPGLALEVEPDRALAAVEREVERRAGAQRLLLVARRSRAAPSGCSRPCRCPRPSAPRRRGRRAAASRSRPAAAGSGRGP